MSAGSSSDDYWRDRALQSRGSGYSDPLRPISLEPAPATPDPAPITQDIDTDTDRGRVAASRRKRQDSAPADFGGAMVPLQIRVPQELVQSLRLLSIDTGKTVSELVLESLVHGVKIEKAWVSRRKTG